MRMPRVKCLLSMFVSFVAFCNGDADINCSSIKVPDVDITSLENRDLEVSWLKNLPVSSFNFSGTFCFDLNGEEILNKLKLPVCPSTKTLKFEEDPAKKSLQKYSINLYSGIHRITLHVNLTMQAPGCPLKSSNKSLTTGHKVMKMRPVEDLSLTCKPDSLSAEWGEITRHDLPLCYNYTAYEILESGQRKEIASKETDGRITSATVYLSHKLHAYKLFQFCVKLRYCRNSDYGLWSDEKCAERRSPAEPPSEPLKMLCGKNEQNKCKGTIGKTKRNVTLIWKLPEKSSWNGRPEKIMITYKMISKENNDNHDVTVNATRTNYTLQGLKLYFDYYVTLTFYSNGGKGPGAQIVLDAVKEPVPPEPAATEEEIEPTVLIVIVVASSVLIVAAVVVFTYLIFKLKRKHKLASLPPMQLPGQITAHSGTDPNIRTDPVDYNFLMTSEETEIQANLRDKSSYEKISCNGSNSSESTSDSVTPLVSHMSDPGRDDVTYYPEQAAGKFGSSITPGERTSDI